MLSAAADAGRGIVYGAVGPQVAFWRCGGAWAVQGLRALGRFGAVPGGVFRGLPRHEGGAVIAGGSHCSAAQRLRALGWFADVGWQDLRAVHDSRGPCSEKGSFLARSSRGVSSDGDLRGFSDAWRAHLAKASSFWMHGARILPGTGDFSVRGHFRDAWSAKPATDCRPGTHFTGILPSVSARNATAPCASTSCVAAPSMLAPNAPPMPYVPVAHAPRAARHSAAMPCTVRGAFVAAEKVSCGLRVSMR